MSTNERKRVRFPPSPVTKRHTYARNDTSAPIPRTPSPVYLDSDESDSEPGPSTPPSASFAQLSITPRPTSKPLPLPLALPTPSSSKTHPLLEVNPYSRATPLCWDVRLPPSTASSRPTPDKYKPYKRSPLQPLNDAELALPATYPPATNLEIAIPQLPWKPVPVTSSKTGGLVRVSDVLMGVYRSLQMPMRKEEFDQCSQDTQSNIARAFYARCERVGQSRAEISLGRKFDRYCREDVEESERESKAEEGKGLKRVDCLAEFTEFRGLAQDFPTSPNPSSWILTLSAPRS